MKMFYKANVASLSASLCDYLITIFLVKLHFDALFSSITGNVFGGLINFLICRRWVFEVRNDSVALQSKRYLLVWTGNLFINAFGLYLFINVLKVPYIIAKIITSTVVSFAYNYPIQKRYVFKTTR